jgi:hypothetical protein
MITGLIFCSFTANSLGQDDRANTFILMEQDDQGDVRNSVDDNFIHGTKFDSADLMTMIMIATLLDIIQRCSCLIAHFSFVILIIQFA